MQPTNSIVLAVFLRALLIGAMPAPLPSSVDDNPILEGRAYYSSAPFASNLLNVPHTNSLTSQVPLTKTAFVTVTATRAVTHTIPYAPPQVSKGSLSILTHAPAVTSIHLTVTATTSVTRTEHPTRAPPHVIPSFSRASSSTPLPPLPTLPRPTSKAPAPPPASKAPPPPSSKSSAKSTTTTKPKPTITPYHTYTYGFPINGDKTTSKPAPSKPAPSKPAPSKPTTTHPTDGLYPLPSEPPKPASSKVTTTTKPKPKVTPYHTYTYGYSILGDVTTSAPVPSSTATKKPHPLTIGTPA